MSKKILYPKSLFKLQLDFAFNIANHQQISLSEAIFLYTNLYVKILGFHDEKPPEKTNPKWQEIINKIPATKVKIIDYFFQLYITYQSKPPKPSNQKSFGCFAYSYHKKTNKFELHFINADKKGNLSQNRQSYRQKELINLFTSMKKDNKSHAKVFLRSWLQNIKAFNRLFPPAFTKTAKPWKVDLAQDFSHWGQFVNRHGYLKHHLTQILLKRSQKKLGHINKYFPLPCLQAETNQSAFYKYYKIQL